MALSLKYTKTLESSTSLTITDGTGAYSSPENLGGYGVPNSERDSVNLGLIATLKSSDGNVNLKVTRTAPGSASPTTVTEWKVELQGGGYHRIAIFTAPTYDNLAIYSQYDVVYDPDSDKFYYYSNTEDSVASAFSTDNGWKELVDVDILEKSTQDVETDSLNKTIINDFLTYGLKACFAVKSEDYYKQANCKHCIDDILKENFKILSYRILSEATSAAGNYVEGQIILEKAEELCSGSNKHSCNC